MAYRFVASSSQYLRLQNAQNAVTAFPITIFVRARSTDTANNQAAALYLRDSGTYNSLGVGLWGGYAGDYVSAINLGINGSVTYAGGAWHSAAAVSAATASHSVNVDDTVDSSTSSVTFEGYGSVIVGGRLTPSFNMGLNGDACAVALWDVALTAAECHSLNIGFSPRRVRPQSLRVYAPLVRDLQAWVNKNLTTSTFVATNSPTVSEHPRCYGM